ncbi:MAG: phosphoesterase [Cyclobacteriaceae bacterium]|nr:MAG: phosphoesterase [Cyclobacteriaceae bacterium]
MSDILTKLIMLSGIFAFDLVIYYLLGRSFPVLKTTWRYGFNWFYWTLSAVILTCFWFLDIILLQVASYNDRKTIIISIALVLISKILAGVYLLLDEITILGLTLYSKYKEPKSTTQGPVVTRKQFLYRAAVMMVSVPVTAKGFNLINQAYDYQVRQVKILLPNLPQAFHGLRIGQISDIHCGSFNNKAAVTGGVDLLMQQKPDLIFFTGDLVNRQTKEVDGYINTFNRVKAPLGVYSVLGNHDYGDYRSWPSISDKRQDFQDMLTAHKQLGWKLLRNENHILHDHGASLAILGVENWGIKRFSKYGDVEAAHKGTEEVQTKLLLSHDPSHWEAKVLDFQDIDITFSGHTHGFQFGIETGNFKWSPSQYLYKQWAGLYQKGPQYIYVNRGYGFVGIPGRVGISPEITIIELVRS